jgi:hypothetical protein
MSATICPIGWVEVSGRLEPEAIATSIADDAHRRVADALFVCLDGLRADGPELNRKQRIAITHDMLRAMDGFERATLDTLMDEVTRHA